MLLGVLRSHLAPYKKLLIIVVGLQFVSSMAALLLPTLNAAIIDNGVTQGDTGYIIRTGGLMLGVSLVQISCTIVAVYFASRTSMGFGRDLRAALFHRVGTFSGRELTEFGAPSLITRNTNDVQQIQTLLQFGTTMMVTAPIMMVGATIMSIRQDVGLAKVLLVAIPAIVIAITFIVSRMIPGFRVMQERIDNVNRILREQISGIRVVRAFVREQHETERFSRANDDLTAVALTTGRWMATTLPTLFLILNLSLVGVLWVGGVRVDAGEMEIGAITAFITYLMQIMISVMMATFTLIMVPRASISAGRISEVLETTTSVPPPLSPVAPAAITGEMRFREVEFSYPGAEEPVISDISFTARPGTTTAIIGSTGSGKTTLVNLIPRIFDPTAGSVELDGVDIRQLDPDVLYAAIGLIPQRPFLFSGTVASNLRIGREDATEAEMWHALEVAQAKDFVEEKGLDSPVAQGGSNLSGGQRQRLAIARAIIKRPQVLLFDDSFSALDLATDARLRRALKPETTDATVIVVAQRVSTIKDADQIVVVEDGRIVGLGTHHELLAECRTYQEIVESQLSIEDVA